MLRISTYIHSKTYLNRKLMENSRIEAVRCDTKQSTCTIIKSDYLLICQGMQQIGKRRSSQNLGRSLSERFGNF